MLEMDMENPVLLPYQELEENVWLRNTCAGCQACVSICPAEALAFSQELSRPSLIMSCEDCKACLDVCPRMPANLRSISSPEVIGPYLDIMNARSRAESSRFQKGGAVTAMLSAALDEELVDCAVVMGMDRWTQKPYPRVVYDSEDLERSAGSKYTSNAVMGSISAIGNDQSVKSIALVGTPCAIQAAGLLRRSSNEFAEKLAHKMRFLIGLFCFEAFDDSLIGELTCSLGTQSWRIDKMNAHDGKMVITLRDGSLGQVSLADLAGYVRPGCRYCSDFTAKLSDVSVGSAGSAPGMSSVVIRTQEGMGLFKIAEEMGFIEARGGVDLGAIEKMGRLKLKRNGF